MMDDNAKKLLEKATQHYELSQRAVSGCIKLARTIADMKQKEEIDGISMEEAVKYRKPQGPLDMM